MVETAEELHAKGRANALACRTKYRKDYTRTPPIGAILTCIIASGYVVAGLHLLTSGEGMAVITESLDRKGKTVVTETSFLEHDFAVAWAGWLVVGRLFMALINTGFLPLGVVNVITLAPLMYLDYLAAQDVAHFTWMLWAWMALDALILCFSAFYRTNGPGSMYSKLATGIFGGRLLGGITLFVLNKAPFIQPSVNFYSDPFVVAWAGWSLSSTMYIFLVNNKKMSLECCNAVSMVANIAVSVYALGHAKLFDTNLIYAFMAADGVVAVLGFLGMDDKFPSSLNWFVGKVQKDHLP